MEGGEEMNNTRTPLFIWEEGINFFVDNGELRVYYDIETLLNLSENERIAIQNNIKSYAINKGLIAS